MLQDVLNFRLDELVCQTVQRTAEQSKRARRRLKQSCATGRADTDRRSVICGEDGLDPLGSDEARAPLKFTVRRVDGRSHYPVSGPEISAVKERRASSSSLSKLSQGFAPLKLRFGRVSQWRKAKFPPHSSVRISMSLSSDG